jgi:hypothetical protein
MAFEHNLSALCSRTLCGKGHEGRDAGRWRRGKEILQALFAGNDFRWGGAEPLCQCVVYKKEASTVIDRVKADPVHCRGGRRVVALLVAARRFDFARVSDVLDRPETVSLASGKRVYRNLEASEMPPAPCSNVVSRSARP